MRLVPVRLGHVGQFLLREDAGIGAKDVECAKTFDDGSHGILAALLHADIGVLVMGAQLLGRCLTLFTVDVGNDDIGPRLPQHGNNALADTLRTTGDKRGLSLQGKK